MRQLAVDTMMSLRSVSILALLGAALSAHAVDAYSNVVIPYSVDGFFVGPGQTLGYQFTSSATGTLTGFTVAMNNLSGTDNVAFTLDLFADSGSGTLGTLLGTYSGVSSGIDSALTSSALVSVPATGAPVALTNTSAYWLVARSDLGVIWNVTANGATQPTLLNTGGSDMYGDLRAGTFSVQVEAVPEPASLAAVGFGVVTVLRRRKR